LRESNVNIRNLSHAVIRFSSNEWKKSVPGVCEYCNIGKFLIRDSKQFEELRGLVKEFRHNLYKWIALCPRIMPSILT